MSLIKDLFQAGKIIPQAEHPLSKLVVTSKLEKIYTYISKQKHTYTQDMLFRKNVFFHTPLPTRPYTYRYKRYVLKAMQV